MPCPTEQQLTSHLRGELSVSSASELKAHLDSCSTCRETFYRLHSDHVQPSSPSQSTVALSSRVLDTPHCDLRSNEEEYLQSLLGPPRAAEYIGSIDRYDVESELGRGGMGIVFRAYDHSLQRRIAIKVLAPEVAAISVARERFRREALAAAAISDHDSVVTIYAVGEHNRIPYIAMQFVQGCSLQEKLNNCGALGEEEVRNIGHQLAKALDFAHRNGLIHRDIKPSNILLDEELQRVRLADFGLARWVDDATITLSGTIVGTVAYMSPEQANGQIADERSDLYSLGAVLFAAATGQPPFQAESTLALLRKVCDQQPQEVRQLRDTFSEELSSLIKALLAKDPADRCLSAREVAQMLRSDAVRVVQDWTRISADSDLVGAESNSPAPGSEFLGRPIGFDIGTKSSHVSFLDEKANVKAATFAEQTSAPTLLLVQDGKVLLGPTALTAAQQDARGLVDRIAGRIGTEQSMVQFLEKQIPSEVLYGLLACNLARDVRRQIGYFSHVCYTIAGCYNETQRKSYRDAFEIASLNSLRPLNSSSAIAVDFLYQKGLLTKKTRQQMQRLLVIRCGASSFDATVLRFDNGILQTLAIEGDARLGGSLWDDRIAQHVLNHIKSNYGDDISDDPTAMFLLMQECEAAKAGLSTEGGIPIRLRGRTQTYEGRVKDSFLAKISKDLLSTIERHSRQALQRAGLDWAEVDYVLLAGGVTGTPNFRKLIRGLCKKRENCLLGDPASTANGAALFASQQMHAHSGNVRFEVREVSNFGYAIRTQTKPEPVVIVKRGSSLPIAAEFSVTPVEFDQGHLDFEILELGGPQDAIQRVAAQCQIRDLPPDLAAGTPFQLALKIDEGGIFSLTGDPIQTGNRYRLNLHRPHGVPETHIGYWKHWLQSILLHEGG